MPYQTLALILYCSVVACGLSDDGKKSSSSKPLWDHPLAGKWLTECQVDDEVGASKDVLLFTQESLSFGARLYDGSDCQTPLAEVLIDADYQEINEEAQQIIDVMSLSTTITLLHADVVSEFDAEGYCDQDWHLDRPETFYTDCDGAFPIEQLPSGTASYSFDGDALYVGEIGEGGAPYFKK